MDGLLQLCRSLSIGEWAEMNECQFGEGDIIALPGGDGEVPSVNNCVNNWDEFLQECAWHLRVECFMRRCSGFASCGLLVAAVLQLEHCAVSLDQ
jgi:hypothetical protein